MEGQQCLHKPTRDLNVNGTSHFIRNTLVGNFCFPPLKPCTRPGSLTLFPRKEHCHHTTQQQSRELDAYHPQVFYDSLVYKMNKEQRV